MLPNRFLIHTNAPVNQTLGLKDADGNWLDIYEAGYYRCHIKKSRDDASALLTFATSGGGDGTIQVITQDGHKLFWFSSALGVTANLEPGDAIGDVIRIDDPDWQFEFSASVIKGVTPP